MINTFSDKRNLFYLLYLLYWCWWVEEIKASCEWDLAEWWECLADIAKLTTVLGSILASSDTVKSDGRQMEQFWKKYIKRKNPKKFPFISFFELIIPEVFKTFTTDNDDIQINR